MKIVLDNTDRPGTYDLADVLKDQPLEERIYRLRCVEAWSMVVPWIGFELAVEFGQPLLEMRVGLDQIERVVFLAVFLGNADHGATDGTEAFGNGRSAGIEIADAGNRAVPPH